jgi:hypothetical protein
MSCSLISTDEFPVWLVREDADEEYETVLERLSELPESTEIQVFS